MVLDEYIDKGIYFKQLMRLAEQGVQVRLLNGIIEVGDSGERGVGGTMLTYDSIEYALTNAFSRKGG